MVVPEKDYEIALKIRDAHIKSEVAIKAPSYSEVRYGAWSFDWSSSTQENLTQAGTKIRDYGLRRYLYNLSSELDSTLITADKHLCQKIVNTKCQGNLLSQRLLIVLGITSYVAKFSYY